MNYTRETLLKNVHPNKGRRIRGKLALTTLLILLILFAAAIVITGAVGWRFLNNVLSQAPELNVSALSPSQAATYIYDRNGKRVQKLTLPEANRDLVTLDHIPDYMQHAFVAIEDERFYEHNGIDPKGIVRAAFTGITTGSFSEGASTITQQLLKNSIFTDWTSETTFEERLRRKIQEQYLALKLEKITTKEQILEDYLNTINLGAGCYGVQAAAYRYFGKNVSELTLSEAAVIAGITKNPTRYNPIINPENNAARRKLVLNYMLDQGYITQDEYDEALADDVYSRIQSNMQSADSTSSIYTYYQDALIDQVIDDLINIRGYTYKQAYRAVYTGGLRIFSAQDDEIQQILNEEFENADNFPKGTEVGIDYALSVESPGGAITDYGNDDLRAYVREHSDPDFDLMYGTAQEARADANAFRESVVKEGDTVLGERVTITPQPQASAVIIDQSTGYVSALVGGRGQKDASLTLNRASYTTRQPGSTFKILTAYAPALNEGGMTLATIYDNDEYAYSNGVKVSNWDLSSAEGPVTIRDAIVESINVVAVKCITDITPLKGYEYAKAFGITTLVDKYDTGSETLSDIVQPLALGGITKGVTCLELCGAYACIANGGQYIAPKFYTQVLDQYGNVILDNLTPASRRVIDAETAYLLTDAMKDVISSPNGTAYGLIDPGFMPTAGKSGTTSSYKDIWFVGYTPYYTCSVWGGYDNNAALPDEDIYHTYNKILWNSIMNRIHKDLPISAFSAPSDIVTENICLRTGMAASPGCPTRTEKFKAGTQPSVYCSEHGSGRAVTEQDNTKHNDLAPDKTTIFDQVPQNSQNEQHSQNSQNEEPGQDSRNNWEIPVVEEWDVFYP